VCALQRGNGRGPLPLPPPPDAVARVVSLKLAGWYSTHDGRDGAFASLIPTAWPKVCANILPSSFGGISSRAGEVLPKQTCSRPADADRGRFPLAGPPRLCWTSRLMMSEDARPSKGCFSRVRFLCRAADPATVMPLPVSDTLLLDAPSSQR
jgi:hypothetical protein